MKWASFIVREFFGERFLEDPFSVKKIAGERTGSEDFGGGRRSGWCSGSENEGVDEEEDEGEQKE